MAVTLRNAVTLNGGIHMDTWSPQLLFPAASQDVWYDPGDINLTWRRNLLTYTEQIDNASVWLKLGGSGSSVAGNVTATAAPDGTFTADKFSVGTGSSSWYVAWYGGSLSLVAGRAQTFSIYVKAAGYNFVFLRAHNNTSAISASGFIVNLLTGAITYPLTPTLPLCTGTTTFVGDGWWRVTVTSTANLTTYAASGGPGIWPVPNASFQNDAGPGPLSFTGDGTSGVYLWGAQFENGAVASPYQRITDGVADYLNYSASPPVMFQDYQGTLITSQVEQPVGLILDKSQGLVLGSELVTNGDFSGGSTGWGVGATTTITGGGAVSTATPIGSNILQQGAVQPGAGKLVNVSFVVSNWSGGNLQIYVNDNALSVTTSNGTFSIYILSTGSSGSGLIIRAGGTAFTGTLDNISLKTVEGNHASQSAPNSRPYLRARHNLLTYSEEFDNAAWTKTNSFIQANLLTYSEQFDNAAWGKNNGTVTANAGIAPDGTITADKFIPNATATTHALSQTAASVYSAGGTVTYSVRVKADPYAFFGVNLYDSPYTGEVRATFNLTTLTSSTATLGTAPTGISATITDIGNEWRLITVRCTFAAGTGVFVSNNVNPTNSVVFGAASSGDGTSGILIWGAQLVQGSAPGDYQVTTSAAASLQYLAPNGTLTAKSFVENSTTAEHYFVQTTASAVTLGGRYTYSFYVKANGRSSLRIYSFALNNYTTIINFETNTVFSSSGGTSPTISSVSVGNGWYRVAFSDIVTALSFDAAVMVVSGTSTFNYAGDNTSGVYLWGAMLNYGSSAGTYQRTAASSYSTVGTLDYDPVGQKTYLWFDGIDDSLVTNSIDFSSTNKMFVCAGVTKSSDAAAAILVELSATATTNAGTFYIAAPEGTGANYFSSKMRGTINPSPAIATSASFAAPITVVVSALGDISTRTNLLRLNGTQVASISTDQGTGNFGNYPLYIGRRGNASLPFKGLLYNLMIIGTQVDPVNIRKAERFVADKTGITI